MKPKYLVAVLAILVIAVLEAYALSRGIDGVALSASMAGIGGIAGYIAKAK